MIGKLREAEHTVSVELRIQVTHLKEKNSNNYISIQPQFLHYRNKDLQASKIKNKFTWVEKQYQANLCNTKC